MTLHRIEDDLRDHSWYEHLFVTTIGDVEGYLGCWSAFEDVVAGIERPSDSHQDS